MTADLIQGSEAWKLARVGKVTASRVADIIAKTKSGPSASRANYLAELVAERLTGNPAEQFVNSAMQWGTNNEAEARAAYSFRADADVTEVGFIAHPRLGMSGCSPDGLVGDDGLVEFKCPNTATHIDTLMGESIPSKYITQMQWQMACCERRWVDFVSYDPRLPEAMRLFVQRVYSDGAAILSLERAVAEFLKELDDKVRALTARYGQRSAA